MNSGLSLPWLLVCAALAAPLTAGCGSGDDDDQGATEAEVVLDPTHAHYGSTAEEWAAQWFKWFFQLPQTDDECVIPIADPTGEQCDYGQSGDVFFLAGTFGGTVVRNKCVIPAGKAIFFPILNFTADNAGVEPSSQVSDEALKGTVKSQMDDVPVDMLSVSFDGEKIPDLGRFETDVTKFTYTLGPEPNTYTCLGATGVTGKISPAYEAGFYVMLAPPAKGAHTLHFKGASPASSPPLKVDVTYKFTVK